MDYSRFHKALETFFEGSTLPRPLWLRLLDSERLHARGIFEIPGRVVFALKSHELEAQSIASRKKIKLIVLFEARSVTVFAEGEDAETLALDHFTANHRLLREAIKPPTRQSKITATLELAEVAAKLLNKLAILDPEAKSSPSDWLPLALRLVRVGVYQSFSGLESLGPRLETFKNQISKVRLLNEALSALGNSVNQVEVILPDWIDIESLDLAVSIVGWKYPNLSSSALGALLHKLGNTSGDGGKWGYFAEGESIRALVGPVIEYLTKVHNNVGVLESLEKCVFLDPTDSPGSVLAELVEMIGELSDIDERTSGLSTQLSPQRFVPWLSNHDLAEISQLSVWFALCKNSWNQGVLSDARQLDKIWAGLSVRVGDQLAGDWLSVLENKDDQLVVIGSPGFVGVNKQSESQKKYVTEFFDSKKADFSACWLRKGAQVVQDADAVVAFVLTNSITQGEQVSIIWPKVISNRVRIAFARPSIKWSGRSDASGATGVSIVIVGLTRPNSVSPVLYSSSGATEVDLIGPYLVPNIDETVVSRSSQISNLPKMVKGNMPYAESLVFDESDYLAMVSQNKESAKYIKKLVGSNELAKSSHRFCIWLPNESQWNLASGIEQISSRVQESQAFRLTSTNPDLGRTPWRFREITETKKSTLVVPSVTSESRAYVPIGFVGSDTIVSNLAFAVYEAPDWLFPLLTSRTHEIWLRLVSGGLETRLRYSNVLSYNTFSAPKLTDEVKARLSKLGAQIIDARGGYPDISLGNLYSNMPDDLRLAHSENDRFVSALYGIDDPENVPLTQTILMKLYAERR